MTTPAWARVLGVLVAFAILAIGWRVMSYLSANNSQRARRDSETFFALLVALMMTVTMTITFAIATLTMALS